MGDAVLLRHLVGNLIENAVRHNVDGGTLHVVTRTANETCTMNVSNTGPVISRGDLAQLFEPFKRLQPDRTGTPEGYGLGLSIVAAVVEAHGGSIVMDALASGGVRVEVTIPSTPRQSAEPSQGSRRIGSARASLDDRVVVGGSRDSPLDQCEMADAP